VKIFCRRREIHCGHNVSRRSYVVVKIFRAGEIAIATVESVSAPKNVAFNTISDDPRFPIFYLQLKERKISRASLFVRRWSYRVVAFSLLSSGMIVACTTQLRSSRYSRLPFVLVFCTQYNAVALSLLI